MIIDFDKKLIETEDQLWECIENAFTTISNMIETFDSH